MPSSPPEAAADAAAVLERLAPRLAAPNSVLLIDGRSGSGKTTLADWLAPRLRARVLHLEAVYADWTGLDGAAELLTTRLLPAFRAGRPLEWRTWDWSAGRPGPSTAFRPGGRLIVEGCGAVSAGSARLADASIVLDVDDVVRRARILARDPPEALAGHAVWAIAERRLAASRPSTRVADLVLRGGVRVPSGAVGTVSA